MLSKTMPRDSVSQKKPPKPKPPNQNQPTKPPHQKQQKKTHTKTPQTLHLLKN